MVAAAKANSAPRSAGSEAVTVQSADQPAKSAAPTAPATTTSAPATTPPAIGAAVRIHYAIALLQQQGVAWHGSVQQEPSSTETTQNPEAGSQKDAPVPFPISVVAAPYPPQSLFGGEVILDALVDSSGKLTDAQVIHGDSPFVGEAQAAVQTWSFRPARMEGTDVDARIAIAFEFAEPFLPSPKRRTHSYEEPPDADDRAPVPTYTVEPEYPVNSVAEGSVVVLGNIDEEGQLTSTKVIRDNGLLTAATISAMEQWRFLPGKKAGKNVQSAVIVVAAFRRPALARLNSPVQSQSPR